jgi:hypothetical protein
VHPGGTGSFWIGFNANGVQDFFNFLRGADDLVKMLFIRVEVFS